MAFDEDKKPGEEEDIPEVVEEALDESDEDEDLGIATGEEEYE